MKVGNVILAIFLWLCIPVSFVIGAIFGIGVGISGGSAESAVCCTLGAPLILFILGLVVLIMGMEKPKSMEKESYRKDEDGRCPNCGRVIPFDAKVCPYCSKKFEEF